MSIISSDDIALFQADAESMMWDTCTITRPGDDADSYGTTVTVYSGKCRVRTTGRTANEMLGPAAGPTDRHRFRVDIPVAVTGVRFNDRITIDSSINPSLPNAEGFVGDIFAQSYASAQRLACELTLR